MPPRRKLRGRAIELGSYRIITDTEAETLLGTTVSRTLNEPVAWSVSAFQQQNPAEVRMAAGIFNSVKENLRLHARVSLSVPGRSHWLLIWGEKEAQEQVVCLRRLDLRDSHINPDGDEWELRTHKHRWSSAHGERWAYTPTDIAHDQSEGFVGPDDYRAICEAFLAECGISLGPDYRWTDPPMTHPTTPMLWEVP